MSMRSNRPTAKQAAYARRWCDRFMAELARLQLHYCNAFKFWRDCRDKRCRRHRRCCGDVDRCLQARIGAVSRHEQFLARQRILSAAPRNSGAAERTVQEFMPFELRKPDSVKAAELRRRGNGRQAPA